MGHVKDKNPGDKQGNTPLHCAVQNKNEDICRLILNDVEFKSPLNRNGKTPLDCAIEQGWSNIFQLLLDSITP